mgnify:CR=1 FL=1
MLLSSPEINGTVGHDKGEHALFNATIHAHYQIAIALAAMPWINANPSMKESFYSGKYHGYPVLAVAAEKGNLSLVRALLAVPAIDVNLVTDSGHTPLMLAAYYGHLDIVQALLAMPGIDIKKSSQCLPYRGDSPEHISGARVGRSPFAPRTYYSALRLAKLSNEQRIVKHSSPVRARCARKPKKRMPPFQMRIQPHLHFRRPVSNSIRNALPGSNRVAGTSAGEPALPAMYSFCCNWRFPYPPGASLRW